MKVYWRSGGIAPLILERDEANNFYSSPNIRRPLKLRRIVWPNRVAHLGEIR